MENRRSVSKEPKDFRGVSLKRELVEQVEEFIKENPQYKNIADFVHEAVRVRMEDIKKITPTPKNKLPRFEHFNIGPDGARIIDRQLKKIADVYFKFEGIYCDLDKTSSCEHIDFALTVPKIQDIIRKRRREGWKLPDI